MELIYLAAALGVVLISVEIIKILSGDAGKILLWFRLRRRGNWFANLRFRLSTLAPKLRCRLGLHDWRENMAQLIQPALAKTTMVAGQPVYAGDVEYIGRPYHPKSCARWFCEATTD